MKPMRRRLSMIASLLGFLLSISLVQCSDSEAIAGASRLSAVASNSDAYFAKFLYAYPVAKGSAFYGLSGTAKIISQGQGFSQALFSVRYIPEGARCPKNGEKYSSYEQIRSSYPTMKPLAALIVKQPFGSTESVMAPNIVLPAGVQISGCVVLILDGSVRHVGGPFKMVSDLVLSTKAAKPSDDAVVTPLDDEFCFGIARGCQIATLRGSADAAFMRVINTKNSFQILGLYGDVAASVLQDTPQYKPEQTSWELENTYIVRPKCGASDGDHGPQDFYQKFAQSSQTLYSFELKGRGRTSLQAPISKSLPAIQVSGGDCLIHMVRSGGTETLGGIDAENQVFLLTRGSPQ